MIPQKDWSFNLTRYQKEISARYAHIKILKYNIIYQGLVMKYKSCFLPISYKNSEQRKWYGQLSSRIKNNQTKNYSPFK